MGNSSPQPAFKKPNKQIQVCPRCDLMQINQRTTPVFSPTYAPFHSNKIEMKKSLDITRNIAPHLGYELYCSKTDMHKKYRLYANLHPHSQRPEYIKINISNPKNRNYTQYLEKQCLGGTHLNIECSLLKHPAIIKVKQIYQKYTCCRCHYHLQGFSILSQHLQPIQSLKTTQNNIIIPIINKWIEGMQLLMRQMGCAIDINESMFGIVYEGRNMYSPKISIEQFYSKNIPHSPSSLSSSPITKQLQNKITKSINNILQSLTSQLNIEGMTLAEAKAYLNRNLHNRKQILSRSPQYKSVYNKFDGLYSYSSQEVTKCEISPKLSSGNFGQAQSMCLGSGRMRRRESDKKILVISANKNTPQNTKLKNKIMNKYKKQSQIHHLQPSSARQHYNKPKNHYTSIHTLRSSAQKIPPKHQQQRNLPKNSQPLLIQSTHPSKHTWNINKNQANLTVNQHSNPISKIKSMVKLQPNQENQYCKVTPYWRVPNHNMINRQIHVKSDRFPNKNIKPKQTSLKLMKSTEYSTPNKSQFKQSKSITEPRKSIQKKDLLKYQSYYQHIITQPLPYTSSKTLTPEQITRADQRQIQQEHNKICKEDNEELSRVANNIIVNQSKRFLDLNFNYKDWKKVNNEHSDNCSEKKEESMRISERADQESIISHEEKFVINRPKQYSELSEGAQELLQNNRGTIDIIESYITNLQQNSKCSQNKDYIYQQSIIIRGMEGQNNPALPNKFGQSNSLDNSDTSSPIKKLKNLNIFTKLSAEESDNSTYNPDITKKSKESN